MTKKKNIYSISTSRFTPHEVIISSTDEYAPLVSDHFASLISE